MRLFLYGTLMGQAETPMARWLAEHVTDTRPATIAGVIHAVPSASGWFPALLRGQGRVRGIVADCTLSRGEMARIDRYEGREYRRATLRAKSMAGAETAQGWIWRGPLPEDAVAVPGGDFLAWLAATGHTVLSSRNGN